MRVAVSNAYYKNPRLPAYRRRIAATGVAVAAISEAQNVGSIPGYKRYGAPGDRYARGTALYVRDGLRVDGHLWHTATRHIGGSTHRRTVNMVLMPFGGERWAPIVVHANPGRKGPARVQNVRLLAVVLSMCVYALACGYTPIVMGDFNRRATERGRHTPFWLARILGGSMRLAGIDGIVHPPRTRLATFRDRGRPPGSDHPLIVANIVKKKR